MPKSLARPTNLPPHYILDNQEIVHLSEVWAKYLSAHLSALVNKQNLRNL